MASTDPDYGIRDLYNAIANGNYPSWSFYIQVMTFEEAERFPFNPFDLTKVSLLLFLAETVALCGLDVGLVLCQTFSCCSKEWHFGSW